MTAGCAAGHADRYRVPAAALIVAPLALRTLGAVTYPRRGALVSDTLRSSWVAIDATSDRRALARRLGRVRDRMLAGGPAEPSVRPLIASSWDRSCAAGVDADAGLAPLALGADEAGERWRAHPLAPAVPAIRELLGGVHDVSQQMLLLCDADGTLLWLEGAPRLVDAAREVHLHPGADWSEAAAGTNAMGTALALGHPLQVFSAEHFARPVGGWTCSAAPVREPERGALVGVLDLSGALDTAHPHSLAVVSAAARVAEAELRRRAEAAAAGLIEAFGRRVGRGRGQPHALANPSGRVLLAGPDGLAGLRLAIPAAGGQVSVPGGGALRAEPLPAGRGFLLWAVARQADPPAMLRLEALGRTRARLTGVGDPGELPPRHGELVALLLMRPEGWTAERLALELLGDFGNPVTVRAELSRLRRALGARLTAQPYRLVGPVSADFLEVEALLDAGRTFEAVQRYAGELLPASEVPAIAELRRRLELGLRAAVLRSGDADLLARWLELPSGEGDEHACRALLALVGPDDPRSAMALARLERHQGT